MSWSELFVFFKNPQTLARIKLIYQVVGGQKWEQEKVEEPAELERPSWCHRVCLGNQVERIGHAANKILGWTENRESILPRLFPWSDFWMNDHWWHNTTSQWYQRPSKNCGCERLGWHQNDDIDWIETQYGALGLKVFSNPVRSESEHRDTQRLRPMIAS